MNLDELALPGGLIALGVTLIVLLWAIVEGIRSAVRGRRERKWNLAQEEHMIEVIDTAERIDAVVEDLRALDRKVHYRHNIHCPKCGWFARQAEGWPPGVADCKAHGISLRTTHALTGPIEIVAVAETPLAPMLEVPLETSPIVLELPVPIPDDLTELMENSTT